MKSSPTQATTMDSDPELCPRYHHAVELLGRRWTGAIVFVLLRGRRRYSDVRAAIPGMTDRMLSERLRELEREDVVQRFVIPGSPVRVEYALTEKGSALGEAVEAIGAWAHDWLSDAEGGAGPFPR